MTQWVCFDVGEVLVDETRVWTTWAQVLDVPAFTLVAALGASIAVGDDHRAAFTLTGRDDWAAHHDAFDARFGALTTNDLYHDVLPTLRTLRDRGWRVGVCGNQPARRRDELAALGVDVDVLTTSEHLAAEKPDRAFFTRLLAALGDPAPHRVAYVGDRVDNDVVAAAAAGLRPVWLRRGPWGLLGADTGRRAALTVSSLEELAARLDEAFA